jgi:hypothetical protein
MIRFTNDENVAYTRYLYNYIEVRQSLFICLLNQNIEESLYWAYELYYSGYKLQTCEFILDTYLLLYKEDNMNYENKLIADLESIKKADSPLLYGNIIATLSTLQYDLHKFCKKYLKIDVQQSKFLKCKFNIELCEEYIKQFETAHSTDKPYRFLRTNVKYPIRNHMNRLFNTLLPDYDDLYTMLRVHWVYYASKSEVWYSRIHEYTSSEVDDEKKTVNFADDDELDDFYKKWGYDPDEETSATQIQLVGDKHNFQFGIKEFCKEYNLQIKIKKIRTNNISISMNRDPS